MASKSAERKEPVTRGTRNVFADLGFPDAAERQARLRLAYALNQELEARKISQADAAKVLGVTHLTPSQRAERAEKFYVTVINQGRVRPSPTRPGRVSRS